MIDLVGFQVVIMISKIFVENFPGRAYKPKLIQIMQQDNREGKLLTLNLIANSSILFIWER